MLFECPIRKKARKKARLLLAHGQTRQLAVAQSQTTYDRAYLEPIQIMRQILPIKKKRIRAVGAHKNNAPTAMDIPDILVVEKCKNQAFQDFCSFFFEILTPGVGTRDREVYPTRFIGPRVEVFRTYHSHNHSYEYLRVTSFKVLCILLCLL